MQVAIARIRACHVALAQWKQRQNFLVAAFISSLAVAGNTQWQHLQRDKIAYVSTLKSYAIHGALAGGRLLHACIIVTGTSLHPDVVLSNALINMYGKCGSLDDVWSTFSHMPIRDVVSWNTLISAHILHGQDKEALSHFKQMQEDGMQPDCVTCISSLSACANLDAMDEGMKIHDLVLQSGFDMDIAIQNALMNLYGKCGCLEAAKGIFNLTLQDDIISWNAMISAYSHNGSENQVLQLFNLMHQKAMVPNRVTYVSILSVCANKAALIDGKWIHAVIVGSNLHSDVVVGTTLMNMYGKGGSIEDARKMFDSMPLRNVISWNALIAVYSQSGESKLAQQIFYEMQRENKISSRLTFVNILGACANKADLNEGKRLHVFIQGNELETDLVVGNSLVNMYGKCCNLDDARDLFDKMPQRNDITWNVMITNYAQNQHGMKALELFNQMLQEGSLPNKITFVAILDACVSLADFSRGTQMHALIVASRLMLDNVVGNALVNLYSKCGQMVIAQEMFYKLFEHDVISWSAMIAGFALQGQCEEALFFFDQMCQDGVMPNKITYVSVLAACSSQAARVEGKRVHVIIIGHGLELDLIIANALINLYGKCGSLRDARMIFDTMPERDTVSWTAMIAAYAQHGATEHALRIFYQMQQGGIRPNKVTFLSVISACGHTGKVEEGYHWFVSMNKRFGIAPMVDHYNCMIDLFGRAGRLDEAEKLVTGLPSQVTIVSLMALLSACKYQSDVERGERFAKHTFTLFPYNPEPYIMLANIYSAAGRVEDAEKVMSSMRDKGLEDLTDV